MSKKEITYIGLVSHMLKKARDDAAAAGKKLEQTSVMRSAGERWSSVKSGNDPEFSQGNSKKSTKKKSSKSTLKTDNEPLPGHKRSKSKTRPGHLDFVTHKGDKYYNRDGQRQTTNMEGVKQLPYSHWTRHPKTAQDVLDMVDLCEDCKSKIESALIKSKKSKKKSRTTKKTKK